jgi:hypothetical protein
MDTQMLINLALGSLLALVGWLARQLWEAVERLKSDIHEL